MNFEVLFHPFSSQSIHCGRLDIASCVVDNEVDANQTDLKKGDESLDSQNLLRTKGLEDDIGGLNETLADSSPVPLEMTG